MAQVEASQVVPPLDSSVLQEDMHGKATGNIPEESQAEDSFEKNDERLSKILEKLDLKGIESWLNNNSQKTLRRISTLICSEFKGSWVKPPWYNMKFN